MKETFDLSINKHFKTICTNFQKLNLNRRILFISQMVYNKLIYYPKIIEYCVYNIEKTDIWNVL